MPDFVGIPQQSLSGRIPTITGHVRRPPPRPESTYPPLFQERFRRKVALRVSGPQLFQHSLQRRTFAYTTSVIGFVNGQTPEVAHHRVDGRLCCTAQLAFEHRDQAAKGYIGFEIFVRNHVDGALCFPFFSSRGTDVLFDDLIDVLEGVLVGTSFRTIRS